MFDDLTKAVAEFKKAKSVCIFTPEIKSVDKAASVISLAKICLNENKSFQIICPKELANSIKSMFDQEGLEIFKDTLSRDYIVSVNYGSTHIEKVVCKKDEENKKLNFVITPKDNVFNFDNVELISGGNSFDLVFSLGLNKLDDSLEEIFTKVSVISITKRDTEIGKYKFLINGQRSYSEVVYEFAKAFSRSTSEEILNILLQGIISRYKLLENGNNDGWPLVTKLIKYGADFNKAFRVLNYSKDFSNLELQRKVMENIRIDRENSAIWSKVLAVSDVDTKGRIIFNICKDFSLAFVIYNIGSEKTKIVVESNNVEKYPLKKLLKVLSGYGSESRVILKNNEMLSEDFEKRFFEAINSLFNLSIF